MNRCCRGWNWSRCPGSMETRVGARSLFGTCCNTQEDGTRRRAAMPCSRVRRSVGKLVSTGQPTRASRCDGCWAAGSTLILDHDSRMRTSATASSVTSSRRSRARATRRRCADLCSIHAGQAACSWGAVWNHCPMRCAIMNPAQRRVCFLIWGIVLPGRTEPSPWRPTPRTEDGWRMSPMCCVS
jgi:hypothetical protein